MGQLHAFPVKINLAATWTGSILFLSRVHPLTSDGVSDLSLGSGGLSIPVPDDAEGGTTGQQSHLKPTTSMAARGSRRHC